MKGVQQSRNPSQLWAFTLEEICRLILIGRPARTSTRVALDSGRPSLTSQARKGSVVRDLGDPKLKRSTFEAAKFIRSITKASISTEAAFPRISMERTSR